jgi:hypothetical protein
VYKDQFTFDLTPRMEVSKAIILRCMRAAVAELIAEKERVDARGDTLTAEQIQAYMDRRPYNDKQPPYVTRHYGPRNRSLVRAPVWAPFLKYHKANFARTRFPEKKAYVRTAAKSVSCTRSSATSGCHTRRNAYR